MFGKKIIKTEHDVDEMANFVKVQLKKAHEAGQEGIAIAEVETPVFRLLTLEEATHRAELFLQDLAGVHFRRLKKIKLEDSIWKIRYDIGVLRSNIVELVLDAQTGNVASYEVVPPPGKTVDIQ